MGIKPEVIIELSEIQAEQLKPLFRQVNEAYGQNKRGMIIAQVREAENGKAFIASAFLPNSTAQKVLEIVKNGRLEIEDKVEELIFDVERDLEKLKNIINAVPHYEDAESGERRSENG